MFGFFKKKKEVQKPSPPRRFYLPSFATEELLALQDASNGSELGHYKLWTRIMELEPQTRTGRWEFCSSLKFSKGLYVQEILGKEKA